MNEDRYLLTVLVEKGPRPIYQYVISMYMVDDLDRQITNYENFLAVETEYALMADVTNAHTAKRTVYFKSDNVLAIDVVKLDEDEFSEEPKLLDAK